MQDLPDYLPLAGDIKRTTGAAVLLQDAELNGGEPFWIPRSVIEDGENVEVAAGVDLHVEKWWLKRNGHF